ncbi:ABC transporter substrate-binding protein [Microvirga antarctica]|uniref:ABC transporter substrate-binding protein n=1 Tax=Microvirga antarctica TaxID=2819233 RepID=UPI001B3135B7|nr:ABC transporter substrate-binding protein [Microvirga antarctica]
MTSDIKRRDVLQMLAFGVASGALMVHATPVLAQTSDSVTIGWPSDVPSWDPNQRFTPDAQPIYKMVFDQPLDQSPTLEIIPSLVTKWELAADGLSMPIELRDDVFFHNGDKMTMEDFRYSFFERIKAGHKLDTANSWRHVSDIEILSPTKGVMRFSSPAPTAPQWLTFLGSYIVPKKYMESIGPDAFREKPIGTGPYKLVEHQLNSRIVLERNEAYWGPKPKMRRVTFDIIKDPSARIAAIQSGQVDLVTSVPVREVERLQKDPNLAAEINPFTRVILLQVRNDLGFSDSNVRLAAHYAIDKAALSKAFYGGAAVPLSVVATPGTAAYLKDFKFDFDVEKAKALLAKSGFSVDKPAKIRFAATNGQFPSDYDIARALVQMWKKVGIEAELETIEYAKYFELNRGGKLPEATLYSFDNATGDPEIFAGYLLNPKMPFGTWKGMEIGEKVLALFSEPVYDKRIAGYRSLNQEAVEAGATIPLLQSVQTVVRKKNLNYVKYGNAWILANKMSWS